MGLQRLGYVDGLRGLAISGVVLVHVGQQFDQLPGWLRGLSNLGARGVVLFFIISAFTLALSNAGKRFDARNFYTRRFLRIAPMFYLAIIFYLWMKGTGPQPFAPNGISDLDVALTFLLLHGLTPSSVNSVVPGGWSIASEWLFYLVFPFLLVVAGSLWRAVALTGVAIALAVVSRFLIIYFMQYDSLELAKTFSYFSFLYSLPAFALGFVIFHFSRRFECSIPAKWGNVALLIVISLIVAVGVTNIPKLQNQLVTLPLWAALVLASHFSTLSLIDNRAMRFLGEISFSLYLVHFAVIHFMPSSLHDMFANDAISFLLFFIVTMVASAIISTFTYRYVELPMMDVARNYTRPSKAAA